MVRIMKSIWKFICLIPKRIVELSKTGKDVAVGAISTGSIMIPDEKAEERIVTCEECELFDQGRMCEVCTCYMDIKVKFKAAKCPEGKW